TIVSRSVIRDTTPPVVTIDQPADGAFINTAQVIVKGTYSDATGVTILINGIAATLTGNSFTVSVSLTEGVNSLKIHAVDAASNQTDLTRSVTLDTIPPVITIDQPIDGAVISTPQVT